MSYKYSQSESMGFRFKEFRVYREAKNFSVFCIKINDRNKDDKDLKSQIRRALNSIILNIAEGSADNSDNEFARFIGISIRSVYEVVAAFDISVSYGIIDDEVYNEIEKKAEDLVKQLSAFRNSLRKNIRKN